MPGTVGAAVATRHRRAVSERRPALLARALVGLTVRGLALDDRIRYREELTAELHDLARSRQLRHAISALRGSLALRRALGHTDPQTGIAAAQDWRCRIRWHRFQARSDPDTRPDGAAHPVDLLECARCGRYSTVAIRRRAVIAAAVLAIPLAWLLTPPGFAAFLTMGVAIGIPAVFFGDLTQMDIHGPGHQYRNPHQPTARIPRNPAEARRTRSPQ